MKVSLNWIRFLNEKYHCAADPAPDGVDKLVERIGLQLGAVEEVINLGQRYKGIVAVKVVSCQKHPYADKLKVCLVDDGNTVKKVKREQNGYIEIVCGAPNVKVGQMVAWIPPEVAVPSSYDKEPFVINRREIRGVISHGMLASPKELGLGDYHEGLLIIQEKAKPGESFAQIYGLDDYIIDIENKMFTHRPDLFGHLGVAREIAGIQHQVFKSPDWYKERLSISTDGRSNGLPLKIKNDTPKLVPRFCALAIKDIKVGESPAWLKIRLTAVGIRPINNIVDITNFFMMETAQPLHAYDYDKVKTGILGIRLSKKGEKLKLLSGKEIVLGAGAVVITDGKKPIGLGGIMGGADTEVDENTKNIILESANFDMNLTRNTAREYGLFTDAATRFTKNQSPRQNAVVIIKAADDILKIAGGRICGGIIDDDHSNSRDIKVQISQGFINARLGLQLSTDQMKKLLENVEFSVSVAEGKLTVTVPFWRTDISIAEDIVEEIGRLYGYDELPVILPKRDISPAPKDKLLEFKSRLRNILKQAGANEVLTYSFVHESLFKKAGQDKSLAYQIRNAVSPDLQYYRQSITPSLLDKIHPNQKAGFKEFAIFEINKAHNKIQKDLQDESLPMEFEMLSLIFASSLRSAKTHGAAYYQARAFLDYLAKELGFTLSYQPIDKEDSYQVVKPFDHKRSSQVWAKDFNIPLGMVGEYKAEVSRDLKLPNFSAGFEIGINELLKAVPPHGGYRPINRFPELEQDFCLRSSSHLTHQSLTDFMAKNLDKLSMDAGYNFELQTLDIFQKEQDKSHKQTTWRIILWHPARTLTTDETNLLLDNLAFQAKKELKAERI